MKTPPFPPFRSLSFASGLIFMLAGTCSIRAQASPQARAAFDSYIATTEKRLAEQHGSNVKLRDSPETILAGVAATRDGEARLQRGEVILEYLSAGFRQNLPQALLHDWRGTVFLPNVTAREFDRLLRQVNSYPTVFAPEVLAAGITAQAGPNHLQTWMRVRQKHVVTIVLDAAYDVRFNPSIPGAFSSSSRSTRIFEMADVGTSHEHALSPAEEHGFLWRMNTYWTGEERDGGLFLQIESVSLSRSIPTGLGWLLRPMIETVPRESLEFTLDSARRALRQAPRLRVDKAGAGLTSAY